VIGIWRLGNGHRPRRLGGCDENRGRAPCCRDLPGGRRRLVHGRRNQRSDPELAGIVDVTKGSNSVAFTQNGRTFAVRGYRAGPGYDLVTGVGTINAARFVPELAAAVKTGS
jgi:hypothetical protein